MSRKRHSKKQKFIPQLPNPNRPDYDDIEATFLALTQLTIPYGYESLLEPLLPEGLQKDNIGNYFITIGESETLFTCHLDVCTHAIRKVNHVIETVNVGGNGRKIIRTDRRSILGGDNKAGVTILCHMIKHGVPGTYYFFIGEEVGAIGSGRAMNEHTEMFSTKFKRAVAFDRRAYGSVITHQLHRLSCSDTFADALIAEFAKNGLTYKKNPTGIFTDTAVFMGKIPECTNLSAGVFGEHSPMEYIDITYLKTLAPICCKIQWETLPYRDLLLEVEDSEDDLEFEGDEPEPEPEEDEFSDELSDEADEINNPPISEEEEETDFSEFMI